MSRTEPEVPSIHVPLRHEISVTMEPEQRDFGIGQPTMADREEPTIIEPARPAAEPTPAEPGLDTDRTHERSISLEHAIAEDQAEQTEVSEAEGWRRHWPRSRQPDIGRDALEAEHDVGPTERTHSWGWEP